MLALLLVAVVVPWVLVVASVVSTLLRTARQLEWRARSVTLEWWEVEMLAVETLAVPGESLCLGWVCWVVVALGHWLRWQVVVALRCVLVVAALRCLHVVVALRCLLLLAVGPWASFSSMG